MAKETSPSLTPILVDPEAAKDKDRWIGPVDAAAILGCVFQTFKKKEAEGLFQRYLLGSKVVYDRQEIEAFAKLDESNDGMGAVASVLLQAEKERNKYTIELIKASTDAQRTNGEVAKQNAETLREENNALRAQLSLLQTKYLGAIDKWEQAQTQLHERELERLKAEKSEKRKDRAFETMMALGPVLSEQLLGTHIVGKLVKSLTDEQLIALTDDTISFFSAEQKERLKFAVDKFRSSEKKKAGLPKGEADKARDIVEKVTAGSERSEGLKHAPTFSAEVLDKVAGPEPAKTTNGANGAASSPTPSTPEKGSDNVGNQT